MSSEIAATTDLTSEQIDNFHEKGYHIHGKLFSDKEIEDLRNACEEVSQGVYETGTSPDVVGWHPGDNPRKVRKIDNCWKANRTIASAVLSYRLGHIAAQLLQTETIRMWHDQLLHKPAFGGQVVTYHQDWAYWQMIAQCKTVTCWISLDDVHPDSGPMIYLEGSNKDGLLPLPEIISGDDVLEPPLKKDYLRVPVLVPKGHVAFHHGLTLHGSDRNTGSSLRRAMVSHLISGECTYRPGQSHHNEEWMNKQPVKIFAGERFRGPQFPQVYPVLQMS